MWIVHNLRPYLSVRWVTSATTKKPSSKRNLLESFAPCGEPKPPFYLPSPSIFCAFANIYKTSFLVSFSNMKKERASFTGPSITAGGIECRILSMHISHTRGYHPPAGPWLGGASSPASRPPAIILLLWSTPLLCSPQEGQRRRPSEREKNTPFDSSSTTLPCGGFGTPCFPRWDSGVTETECDQSSVRFWSLCTWPSSRLHKQSETLTV